MKPERLKKTANNYYREWREERNEKENKGR